MAEGSIGAAPVARRIDAVDGIRAFAVLAVVAFHFHTGLAPAGFVGVDIFFVISGYVISRSLVRHRELGLGRYVLEFYRRRVVRLVPALACCLVVVSLLSILFVPDSWLSDSNDRTGILAFVGMANFGLLRSMDGYFQARSEFNPFVHTWSLGVEEQFYVLFPLLYWWWARATGIRGGRGAVALAARWAIPVLALVSLVVSAVQTRHSPQMAYYMLPGRFWELAAGALLFRAEAGGWLGKHVRDRAAPTGWIGLALVVAGILWSDAAAFPFPWAACAVLGTVLLIIACIAPEGTGGPVARVLGTAPAAYIGRTSYSLYLWHWPVVCLMRWTTGFSGMRDTLVALVLTLFFGLASYHFVELPFQRARRVRAGAPARVVTWGAAASLLLAVGTYMAYKHAPWLRLSVVEHQLAWDASRVEVPAAAVKAIPATPSVTLFVLGDSHALAYEGMARAAAQARGMVADVRMTSGCSVANLLAPHDDAGYCEQFVQREVGDITHRAKPGDVILLASLRSRRLSDQWGLVDAGLDDGVGSRQAADAALQEAAALVDLLQSHGLVVIMDDPKPVFRAPLFRCSDWFNHMNPVCGPGFTVPAHELAVRDQPVREALAGLSARYPGLVVWDPFPVLCPGEVCSARRDGKPLFFDGDHLSGYGNQVLLPSFLALLEKVARG